MTPKVDEDFLALPLDACADAALAVAESLGAEHVEVRITGSLSSQRCSTPSPSSSGIDATYHQFFRNMIHPSQEAPNMHGSPGRRAAPSIFRPVPEGAAWPCATRHNPEHSFQYPSIHA